jgi:hypothetical protein
MLVEKDSTLDLDEQLVLDAEWGEYGGADVDAALGAGGD